MPDHCLPRHFDHEYDVPWGGGPIMSDSDKPVSFFVRGTMPRRCSDTSPENQSAVVEPRGLPPQRLTTPPPLRPYRVKMKEMPTIDPSEIVTMYGVQYWVKDGVPKAIPSADDELRFPFPKYPPKPLPEPVAGLLKSTRGRYAPTREIAGGGKRKHVCPVQACGKAFTKRTHLSRHIESLHTHEKTWSCMMPFCDKSFTRRDNYLRHQKHHSTASQEVLACTPEDDFKGVLVENPIVRNPDAFNIKPFANIAIHPAALSLWRHQQKMRAQGFITGITAKDCERYFNAHPEDRESALRGDPKWVWTMPPPGPEFKRKGNSCLQGVFKLDIKRDQDQDTAT